jgi:membrane protease YdiL (CAAX protease family)
MLSAMSAEGSRWRTPVGLALATLAVALVLPEWVTPLARACGVSASAALDQARSAIAALTLGATWPVLPALVSAGLLLAAWCLPASPAPLARPRPVVRDETAMAVGVLLLVEPLLHLGFLAWSGWHPSALSRDAALPVPFQAVSAGAQGWWSGMLTILVVSLLVPVGEELFFRGRLLDLLRARLGGTPAATASAVSITTLAFAAAHGSPVQTLFAIPLGLLLALIRLRSGNLGACMVAHACHNSLFLFVGPILFAKPWAAPLLALAGTLLIAVAWVHHPRTSPRPRVPQRWRLPLAGALVVLALAVVGATWPAYRRVQDHLWAGAAHRVIVSWRVGDEVLLRRLDVQETRGRFDDARRAALYERLVGEPCVALPGGNPRQVLMLAQLDPWRFAEETDDNAVHGTLLDLAEAESAWPRLGLAAQALARRNPHALAAVATTHPEFLRLWYPLPEAREALLAQITLTQGHDRRRLLTALERAHPGAVADLLLALPPAHITPLDRRHLFLHYPDAAERLNALHRTDPARAQAFVTP